MTPDFVSIGCLGIDNVIGTNGEKRLGLFGGNAAWGAAGIHLWHAGGTGVVSRMGDDFPKSWVNVLKSAGIGVEGIHPVAMRHLMLAGMVYDKTGERYEVSFNEEWQSNELVEGFPVMTPELVTLAHESFAPDAGDIPDAYACANALVCARHYDRQMGYVARLRAQNPDAVIVLDTGLQYMRPGWEGRLPALFSRVDVVVPSEAEVEGLFGKLDPCVAARRLHELGAKNVVIKLGRRGCLVDEGGRFVLVGAYHAGSEAVDPTGAGDSFCGGLLVGYVRTHDLVEAAKYGTVSSSFAVERFGVDAALDIPRRAAEERLKNVTCQCLGN